MTIHGHSIDAEQAEKEINCHIQKYILVLKNLIDDADNETVGILFDFILSTINLSVAKNESEDKYHKNIELLYFFRRCYFIFFVASKNKFPSDMPLMNRYLYEMIHELQDRQSYWDKIGDDS